MSDVNIAKEVKIFSELINLAVIRCCSTDPIHRCSRSVFSCDERDPSNDGCYPYCQG